MNLKLKTFAVAITMTTSGKHSITEITLVVCLCVRVLVLASVCVVPDRSSSDSSDCHIVRAQNSKSSPSVVPYNVTISTSPEPDLRRSSSTLQDEELTGSYTVSSTTGNDYNVRSGLSSTVFRRRGKSQIPLR